MKPFYTHDCDKCHFLGNFTYNAPLWNNTTELMQFDLYRCATTSLGKHTIIARHGDDGPEYASMPDKLIEENLIPAVNNRGEHSTYSQALIEGYHRAGGNR